MWSLRPGNAGEGGSPNNTIFTSKLGSGNWTTCNQSNIQIMKLEIKHVVYRLPYVRTKHQDVQMHNIWLFLLKKWKFELWIFTFLLFIISQLSWSHSVKCAESFLHSSIIVIACLSFFAYGMYGCGYSFVGWARLLASIAGCVGHSYINDIIIHNYYTDKLFARPQPITGNVIQKANFQNSTHHTLITLDRRQGMSIQKSKESLKELSVPFTSWWNNVLKW